MFDYKKIFEIKNQPIFEQLAIDMFRCQALNNPVYKRFLGFLNININNVKSVYQIPFMPVGFFKKHKVITGKFDNISKIFTSSGTTGVNNSRHYVTNIDIYIKSFTMTFKRFYGNPEDFCIIALLPSYLEREGSSLIYMMDYLIKASKHQFSGFYLKHNDDLINKLEILQKQKQKTLLLGVSFALLDLAEKHEIDLSNITIMETGGMKGRRKEYTRHELHDFLTKRFNIRAIHSEYGMTELLSQAYSKGHGIFECPPWMKILIRDIYDPFSYMPENKSGGINIIDLANIYSSAFIETKDIGKTCKNGNFEVLGRFDNSDIRGCNLLIA